ncbi:hypothetical protein P7K49_036977 [Saguinus oedipus]|uniref:Uncharacterized protein n=1 Tax=Saguinus oedipus TaxID=9490 RepID=A0ABQ9TLN7_SAGOE|nr:hypothetical protein P7K49_036977 [Saguinus oedipus]
MDTHLPPDDALWCRVTKPVPAGGLLSVLLTAEPCSTPGHTVKKESAEPTCPVPAHDLQLLPQQAGMASILATAVINTTPLGTPEVDRRHSFGGSPGTSEDGCGNQESLILGWVQGPHL